MFRLGVTTVLPPVGASNHIKLVPPETVVTVFAFKVGNAADPSQQKFINPVLVGAAGAGLTVIAIVFDGSLEHPVNGLVTTTL